MIAKVRPYQYGDILLHSQSLNPCHAGWKCLNTVNINESHGTEFKSKNSRFDVWMKSKYINNEYSNYMCGIVDILEHDRPFLS
jgi:hypothetical protein